MNKICKLDYYGISWSFVFIFGYNTWVSILPNLLQNGNIIKDNWILISTSLFNLIYIYITWRYIYITLGTMRVVTMRIDFTWRREWAQKSRNAKLLQQPKSYHSSCWLTFHWLELFHSLSQLCQRLRNVAQLCVQAETKNNLQE